MNRIYVLMISISLLMLPSMVYAQSDQMPAGVPPVAQSLIPEGDFALKLAPALKLGTPDSEVQAEDMLTSAGIAPRNGWIADYPVTPDIIGELRSDVAAAADSQKLPMGKDEALNAFQNLIAEFGLAVSPTTSGKYAESRTQPDPTIINNYYYEQGPPVVTYYPPPWDYDYLYAWVPYPFWYTGFFFPGFFVLHDFNVVVSSHHGFHRHHRITNHFTDPKTHSVFRVDPRARMMGRTANPPVSHFQRFNSTDARKSAASIVDRSHGRQMDTMNPALQGPSRQQVPANRGPVGQSTIERGTVPDRGSHDSSSFGGRNGANIQRNFQRPPESFGRSLGTPSSPGREFSGGSQRNIQRPPESIGRSFSAPSGSFSRPRSAPAPSFQNRESLGGFRGGGSGGVQSGGSGRSFSGGFSGGHGGGGGCKGRC